MKKIFSILIVYIVAVSALAQTKDSIKFVGESNYSTNISATTISGKGANDTITIADAYTSITYPAMSFVYMGITMTVPSMKIVNIPYAMTGNTTQGNAVFTWDKAATDTVINFPDVGKKSVKVISLHAVYTQSKGTLETIFVFQYGSMPVAVTFTETGFISENTSSTITYTTKAGSTETIPLDMATLYPNAVGAQCDVYCPNGISIFDKDNKVMVEQVVGEGTNYHTVNSGKQSDGAARIVVFPTTNKSFSESAGSKLNATFSVSSSIASGDYTIQIKNIVLSLADATTQTASDEDITIKVRNRHAIIYKVDGVIYKTDSATYGETIIPIENLTTDGKTFSGWSGFPENNIMPDHDITVTGSYNANQYTITFDTDGGSEVKAITAAYGSSITAPTNPTKVGYSFAGWNPALPATMPLNGLTVKATWKANQYTITFDTDGGSSITPVTQDYGTTVSKPTDPTKTGYTFAGWDKEIPSTMPAESVTIKATWKVNQYTITFDTDGGSTIDPITQDYNTAVTKPTNPTKTGYTFAGWDKEIPATMPAESVTIKALWKVNQYTITFDTDGGSDVKAITQDYGTTITKPADPKKVGYTFLGWDKEIPTTMPAENITIKALWDCFSIAAGYSNTCQWYITDDDYKLVVEPTNGIIGTLDDWKIGNAPWHENAGAIKSAEIKNGVTAVTCRGFFDGCANMTAFDLSGLNTDDVTDMSRMFAGCSFKSLDISKLNVQKASNTSEMFADCPNLLELKWGGTVTLADDALSGTATNGNVFVFTPNGYVDDGKSGVNIVIGNNIDNVVLKSDAPMYTTQKFTAGKISYTKNFSKQTGINQSAGWETIVLPFTVQKIESKEKGEVTPFRNGAGSKHFWLEGLTEKGFGNASYIKANVPYIIAMPNNARYADEYNITGDVTFSAEKAEVQPTTTVPDISPSGPVILKGSKYKMYGAYETVAKHDSVYALNDDYYSASGKEYMPGGVFVKNLRDVKPFEAYATAAAAYTAKTALPLFDDEGDTTDVESLTSTTDQPIVIYDVMGIRQSAPRRGLNIINGKKVMVR